MQPNNVDQQVQLMQSAMRTLEQVMFLSPDRAVDGAIRSILMLITRITDKIQQEIPATEEQTQPIQPNMPQMQLPQPQGSALELAMRDAKAKGGLQ